MALLEWAELAGRSWQCHCRDLTRYCIGKVSEQRYWNKGMIVICPIELYSNNVMKCYVHMTSGTTFF